MCVLMLSVQFTIAQEYTLKQVGRASLRNAGTIMDNNLVKGYFFFYENGRIDKKNSNFDIVVLNEELEEVESKTIKEPKTTYLMESSYNGNTILFKFYDTKAKTVIYRTLGTDGKLSAKKTREANKYETVAYMNGIGKDLKNTNLSSVGDDLFIDIYSFKSKKFKYQVEGIGNDGAIDWTYTPEDRKGMTGGQLLASSKYTILLLQSETKNQMSKDVSFYLIGLSKSGEEQFTIELRNTKYNMLPINAVVNEDQSFTILGEYFDAGDKAMKSESEGLFAKTISADGDEEGETFLSWTKDITPKVPSEHRRAMKQYSVYFHNIFLTNDGNIYAIGEQYKKQISAAGVAFKAIAAASSNASSNVSAAEIQIANMVMIKINPDMEVEKVEVWDKAHSNVMLPEGYGVVSKHLLARILVAQGDFDYSYTQNDDENSVYTVAYTDREKVKGKLSKQALIRFVSFNEGDDDAVQDKMELVTDADQMVVLPAKAGYVLVAEYSRKEKTITLELTEFDY